MSEIRRADPGLRRLMLYVLVILAAVGTAGVIVFQRWFSNVQLLPADEAWPELIAALTWIGGATLLIVLATSIYALVLGSKIKRVGQYPLSGSRTIRDTEILQGQRAHSRGNLLQMVGALLFILAILLLALCVRMVSMFSGSAV